MIFFTAMDETYKAVIKGTLVQLDACKLEMSRNIKQNVEDNGDSNVQWQQL